MAMRDFEEREIPKLLIESIQRNLENENTYTQEDFEYETTLRALED